MANKFADKEEESSDDDASSFEEVPKPVERPSVTAARQEEKVKSPAMKVEPAKSTVAAAKSPVTASAPVRAASGSSAAPAPAAAAATTTPAPSAGGAAEGLRGALVDLKDQNSRILGLLEQQGRALEKQSQQIAGLTEEVDKLKGGSSGGSDNADLLEKIRRLELELEEARSS